MNKTSLSDAIKDKISWSYQEYIDIGANGFTIDSNVFGKIDKLTNTLEIHMICRFSGVPNNRDSSQYCIFDLSKIAAVFGGKMITFNFQKTRVIPIWMANYDSGNPFGYIGLLLDPVWTNKNYAAITAYNNTSTKASGVLGANSIVYNTRCIYVIDIYDATLVY